MFQQVTFLVNESSINEGKEKKKKESYYDQPAFMSLHHRLFFHTLVQSVYLKLLVIILCPNLQC